VVVCPFLADTLPARSEPQPARPARRASPGAGRGARPSARPAPDRLRPRLQCGGRPRPYSVAGGAPAPRLVAEQFEPARPVRRRVLGEGESTGAVAGPYRHWRRGCYEPGPVVGATRISRP